MYNQDKKGTRIQNPMPSVLNTILEIASKLSQGLGCYFLLCRLSMYANAVNITNNKVRTSIVFIGITLL